MNLTEVEIDHLLTLLRDAEREGSYYGRKDHYWQRHERIRAKLLKAVPALPAPQEPECIWTYTEEAFDADVWESACGETWQFLDGGPKENRARFCHGCGRKIRSVRS